MLEASSAAPGVHVLGDEAGQQVRVEHGDGWVHAVLERSDGPHLGTELWRTPSLAERPPDLPAHVPFLPGAAGLVVFSADRGVGIWPWHDGKAGLDPLDASALSLPGAPGSGPPGLAGFTVAGGDAVPGGVGLVGLAAGGGIAGLVAGALGDRGGPHDGEQARLGLGMEHLVEEARREGWERIEERLVGPPFPSREVRLCLQDRLRLVVLSTGGAGAGGEVVLLDLPMPREDPASG